MEIAINKMIHKCKRRYARPARYSSTTMAYVFKDGELSSKIQTNVHGGFNKFVEKMKKKYPESLIKVNKKPETCYIWSGNN